LQSANKNAVISPAFQMQQGSKAAGCDLRDEINVKA
jgi:hypothetical protein